ncbi:FCD domain-containing protein [Yinghuangia sp. ASG 101]|uniref:FadR/GntR family transcriptional regulator n=1 Tax=Yinghuangia sp. ASG 101 TaxID=2896848 RepID=UPI001E484285|nr:FCD domain-containing protein [Yinghuangia sp. ASG 101]UGQ11827.1 FCD domain-containing protein [Yinghuangia sp. ASG 101]
MSTQDATAAPRQTSRGEAVAKRIEDRIAEQNLPSGHRLGTKESLRREFDVAVATLNESIRLLLSRGTISVRPGVNGGIFVASPPALVRLGRKMLELSGDSVSVSDCLVVRDTLEPLIAHEAMRHRTAADIADMRRLAQAMASDGLDTAGYLAANWALHRRIAEITPNQILRHTYISLLEFVESRLKGVTPDEPARVNTDGPRVHRDLVEAIAGTDAARLTRVLDAHAALTVARGRTA